MEIEKFESELEDILNLLDVFYENGDEEQSVFVDSVTSYSNAGILTKNKGIVIKLSDKSEFQLTIVKVK